MGCKQRVWANIIFAVQVFKSGVQSSRLRLGLSQERRRAERLRSTLVLTVSADLVWIEQADCKVPDNGATEAVDNLCANLHIVTDPGSPWSQPPVASTDRYMRTLAVPQRDDGGDYLTETTTRSPSLYVYDQWPSNTVQQDPPTSRQEPVARSSHWRSPPTCLPQEVIDSVENGTVDPRALNLR